MRLKLPGETRLRVGDLDDLDGLRLPRRPRIDSLRLSLSTGWHALDLATELGGLPLQALVAVSGSSDAELRQFVYALIGHQQARRRPVAVVDTTADFFAGQLRHTPVTFSELALVSSDDFVEAIRAARRLIKLGSFDVVLLHAPYLDEWVQEEGTPALESALDGLRSATMRSACVGLINLGRSELSDPIEQASLHLRLRSADRVEVVSEARAAAASVRTDEHGAPARIPDLVSGGLMANIIRRSGDAYSLGGYTVRGRRSLEEMLDSNTALSRELDGQLREEVLLRGEMSPVGRGEPEEPVGSSEESGEQEDLVRFSVNTWFSCDRAPVLPLRVGLPYELCLRIGLPEVHAGGQSAPLARYPDFGAQQSVELVVSAYSGDLEIAVRTKRFRLDRHAGSDLVTFGVQARHAGSCRLQLIISTAQELELLHQLELTVPAIDDDSAAEREAG
jgi:hypothetical protein